MHSDSTGIAALDAILRFGMSLAKDDNDSPPMNLYLRICVFSVAGSICALGQAQDSKESVPRVHRTWTLFSHPRAGFELPIPPGVSAVGNPEAESEPQFRSADQNFIMSAWGGVSRDHPVKVLAAEWNSAQGKADREITYQRRGQTWFVVSGTDSRGIEFYEKFTMRGQQVAFLDITFPRTRLRQFESWVEQIENGFRPIAVRGGVQELDRDPARAPIKRMSAEAVKPSKKPKPEPKSTERTLKKQAAAEVSPSTEKLPSANKVAGKPGFVYSPFSSDQRIVDVTDVPSGTKVKCPYTMKIFKVP